MTFAITISCSKFNLSICIAVKTSPRSELPLCLIHGIDRRVPILGGQCNYVEGILTRSDVV